MYPHREYYRNESTIRSLPIAIKASSDNSWSSVIINDEYFVNNSENEIIPLEIETLRRIDINRGKTPIHIQFSHTKPNIFTQIKKQCFALNSMQILAFIFHASNIFHYLFVPFLLVFWHGNKPMFYCAYYTGIINDTIFILYVTIVCKRNKLQNCCVELTFNLFLAFPYWLVYEEFTYRTKSRWIVNDLNIGFFFARCVTCPLRLYWTIKPLNILRIGEFSPFRYVLRLGVLIMLLLHGGGVLWGLMVIVFQPAYDPHIEVVNNSSEAKLFHGIYYNSLLFAAGIMSENAYIGPLAFYPNVMIICLSLIYFIFLLYLYGYFFLDRELSNKRIIKLQHFTSILKRHLRKRGLGHMQHKVEQNHQNVEIYKKAVALDECQLILRHRVNWALVQDVLFDLNLPALKTGVILGVKHPKVDCFLRHLSTKMRRDFYNAGECIFRVRTSMDKMIVLVEGYLDILADDNKTSIISLEPGSCLGQIALMVYMECKATIRCVTHVKVLTLTKKEFLTATLRSFPEVYRRINRAFQAQMIDAKVRKRTMMMRPPQYDVSVADKINQNLYKICVISKLVTRQGVLPFHKASNIGKVDQNLTLNAIWNYMMVLVSVVVCITYPYFVAFERAFPDWFNILAILMEALIVIDLILTLITYEVPMSKQRVFSWNRRACANHLWHKLNDWSFYLDFTSAIFLELITYTLYNTTIETEQIKFLYYFLKLNRVIKIYKLFHLIWSLQFSSEFYKRLVIHTLTISLIIYYGAVTLYLISCFNPTCYPHSWFRILRNYEFDINLQNPRTDYLFLSSLHYSLIYIHCLDGYTHLSSEYLDTAVGIILSFLGYLYVSFAFMDLANLRFLQLKQAIIFKRDLRDIKKFCFYNQIRESITLESRLLEYYRLQWKHYPGYFYQYNHGNYMTKTLRHEILMTERYETLMKVPLLKTFGKKFCRLITLKSKIYLVPVDDVITYRGNMNKEMLILVQGYCSNDHGIVIEPLNPTLANLKVKIQQTTQTDDANRTPGENKTNSGVFGLSSLLFNLPEGHTVTTTTPCIFISVDGSALQETLLHYPRVNNLLLTIMKSQEYYQALDHKLDVDVIMENKQFMYKHEHKHNLKHAPLKRFFAYKSFINVLNYCAGRKEAYGYPFETEEIAFLRFGVIPITIDPRGGFFRGWVILRAFVSWMLGITSPLMLLTYKDHFVCLFLYSLNVICDCVILFDCVLLSYLAYNNHNGILVVHPYRTLRNYGGRGMLIDLLMAFPLEWIYWYGIDTDPKTFAYLRLFKVLQVYKYFIILNKLKNLDVPHVPRMIELMNCISWIVILTHACACVLLASECDPKHGWLLTCRKDSWVDRTIVKFIAESSPTDVIYLGQIYLLSVYWTICLLFGVGFGSFITQGGRNLAILVGILMIGMLLRGYNIITIVSHFVGTLRELKNASRVVDYKIMMRHLMIFLEREENVDEAVKIKFRENAIYYWRLNRGVDKTMLLSKLHTSLLQDTLCYLYEDVLKRVPLFLNMERAFLRILVLLGKCEHFLPHQIIIHQEEVCHRFYIILEGIVHIELARSAYQVNVSKGSIFGHFSKDTSPVMSITATSVDYVHVLSFKSIDYFNILKNYAKFDIELKGVLSEYKDFMQSHFQFDEEIYSTSSWINEMAMIQQSGWFQRVEFYKIYDIILRFSAFINALIIPLNIIVYHWTLINTIIIIDVIFTLAFGIEFVKPYYDKFGRLITDFKLTRARNFEADRKCLRMFEFVCIILILFSYLMYYFPMSFPVGWEIATPRMCFAWLRLVALYRCRYITQKTFKEIDNDIFILKTTYILMSMIIVIHWTACIWILIQEYIGNLTKGDNMSEGYLTGVLLVVNLLTGSATIYQIFSNPWEQAVIIVLMPALSLFRYYLFAKTIVVLYLKVRPMLNFNFQLKQLRAYVKTNNVNNYQIKNLTNHLIEIEKREMGKNFPTLLTLLPTPLTNELKILLYRPLLESCYLFQGTEINFLRNLTAQLRRSVYFAGDVVLHNGEINKCMYFIRKGIVEILSINEDYYEIRHDVLKPGETFGLVQGLFKHSVPHLFTYRAVIDSEVLTLRLDHWEHLLRHFPASKDTIYTRVRNAQNLRMLHGL